MGKYNVLMIMTDQHRYDCMGDSSGGYVETPSLDYLAEQGTIFENAYTAAPSCCPARASLMTGISPWKTGVLCTDGRGYRMGGCIGVNFPHTLAGELSAAGYHTAGIGKMHFFPQRNTMGFGYTVLDESGRAEDEKFTSDYTEWFLKQNPARRGITDHGVHWNGWLARPFDCEECYHPTNWTANRTLEALEKRDITKPFFINMSFARPHSPYDPSEFFFDMYMNKEEVAPIKSEWSKEFENDADRKNIMATKGAHTELQNKRMRAGYYGSITQIDYQIGKVFTYMQKAGIFDNTLVLFLSDHGDMLGDHNMYRKKVPYESSSHIPLIVKLPKGLSEDKVAKVQDAVSITDILPTILEVCEVEAPNNIDGISLLSAMHGEKLNREYVFCEHNVSDKDDYLMITNGKHKYVWHYKTGAEEFFDISTSKDEKSNLIADETYADIIAEMKGLVLKELKTRNTNDLVFVENDQLKCIPIDKKIISPHYIDRLNSSDFYWIKQK